MSTNAVSTSIFLAAALDFLLFSGLLVSVVDVRLAASEADEAAGVTTGAGAWTGV